MGYIHDFCGSVQGSSQKQIKKGVVLRSKDICGFSDHIKDVLSQKGGSLPLPSLARSLSVCRTLRPGLT